MSPTRNSKTIVPEQLRQNIERTQREVDDFERRGQTDTPTHQVLDNLLKAKKALDIEPEGDKEHGQ